MLMKIGNKLYNPEDQPIMIILTDQDKENIKNMLPKCKKYCVYPSNEYSKEKILKWMKEE